MNDFERFVDWADFLNIRPKDAFNKAAELFDHFGVEWIGLETDETFESDYYMEYLNQGDTYALTLVLTDDLINGVKLIATSWGDWYESVEQHYCEENNAIRCVNCGHFTDCAEDWRETICECCNNKAHQ